MTRRTLRIMTAISLAVTLIIASILVGIKLWKVVEKNTYSAYFVNANGLFVGDEIRILGVAVGSVDKIEPQLASTKGDIVRRQAVSGPSRCSRRDSVAVAGDLAGNPTRPGVLRRTQIEPRSIDPAEPHRGARRMGRLPQAAGEAERFAAAHHSGRGELARRIHQLGRGQPAR